MDEIRYKVHIEPMTRELFEGLSRDLRILGLNDEEIYRAMFEYSIEKIKQEGLPDWLLATLSQ